MCIQNAHFLDTRTSESCGGRQRECLEINYCDLPCHLQQGLLYHRMCISTCHCSQKGGINHVGLVELS